MKKNKKILISGGNSGLGKGLVELFLNKGYDVYTFSRSKRKEIDNVNYFYDIDISNKKTFLNMVSSFREKKIIFDIIILNAGYANIIKSQNMILDDEIMNVDINLKGGINSVLILKDFLRKKENFIYINSCASLIPSVGLAAYGASKSGIKYFSHIFNLTNSDIQIKNIYFSFIKTGLTKENKHPMLGLISVEEASNVVYNFSLNNKKSLIYPRKMLVIYYLFQIIPFFIQKRLMYFGFFNHLKKK